MVSIRQERTRQNPADSQWQSTSAARAWALLAGRDMVIPEDVQAVFAPVASHRLERAGVATAADHAAFITELQRSVAVPV